MISCRHGLKSAVVAICVLFCSFVSVAQSAPESFAHAQAWVGARIIDGSGKPAIENATLLVRNGRIEEIGKKVKLPPGVERIDATGKTIIPGLINAHGHVNSEEQLGKYLRDGVTTILSLGGEKEFALRELCAKSPAGTVPHLYVAGVIQDSSTMPGAVTVKTTEEARKSVDSLVENKPDIVKVRVDDFLGARSKMTPEVYGAVIDEAHKKGFRTAAHVVLLDDAKGLLNAGVDYIAHSVRDREVDQGLISLLKKRNVPYSPTLTREVAVFTYADTPDFFSEPFFLKEADSEEIARMQDPAHQDAVRKDAAARWYKEHMEIAMRNLKLLRMRESPSRWAPTVAADREDFRATSSTWNWSMKPRPVSRPCRRSYQPPVAPQRRRMSAKNWGPLKKVSRRTFWCSPRTRSTTFATPA